MKAIKLAVIVAGLMIFSAVATLAMVNHGAEEFAVNGGSKGEVQFPHKVHLVSNHVVLLTASLWN